ncbi:MAG: GAF domain-containing protein, partial [Planctomycetes bacterium]|nr:GAF domain-containing protein [Planctomycetota bacterium]
MEHAQSPFPAERRFTTRLAADHHRQCIDVIIVSQNHEFAEAWRDQIMPYLVEGEAADRIEIAEKHSTLETLLLRFNDPFLIIDIDTVKDPYDPDFVSALDKIGPVSSLTLLSKEANQDRYEEFADAYVIDDYRFGAPNSLSVQTLLRAAREKIYLRNRLVAGEGAMNSDERLRKLSRIGLAFSRERDLTRLLNVVLRECRELLNADAGSVYILEAPTKGRLSTRRVLGRARRMSSASAVKRQTSGEHELKGWHLRFAAAHNDSVKIPFKDFSFPVNFSSIAGYCVLQGETLNLPDVYEAAEGKTPFVFNRKIDLEYNYRCVSMISVPMVNMRDELVGVIQLMNKKRDPLQKLDDPLETPRRVLPFNDDDVELARMLGTQAGAAIDNVRLYDSISNLFESFVYATVRSIEQRDPSTAGHSARVDRITVGVADIVNRKTEGPFADVAFTDEEMVEIHYAALLHDVGKIGVREHVLTKANKLFPDQFANVKTRAELISTALQLQASHDSRAAMIASGHEHCQEDIDAIMADLDRDLLRLAEDVTFVEKVNTPGFMSDEQLQMLDNVYNRSYRVPEGIPNRLIYEEEYHALSIRRGSLSSEERLEMQSHVAKSRTFLEQIPWTPELANVPQIAGQHHEKMNGQGYPDGVPAAETPVQSRIMAVADVFDSLTSADRPYKPAIPLERALEIMRKMAEHGELDPDIV